MDDPELCNPAVGLKNEEAERNDQENENGNEGVHEISILDEQTTRQCIVPRYEFFVRHKLGIKTRSTLCMAG